MVSTMTSPPPGDVWLADIPFSDGHGTKTRPVLVMWVDATDAIVVSVTSSGRDLASHAQDRTRLPEGRGPVS
jgi:hypothetical protein